MLVVLLSLFAAAPKPTLFVQASTLNLRVQPNAKSKIVSELKIGTACTLLAPAADGFAELKCPTGTGFAKRDLLADKAPDYSAIEATMKDVAKPYAERLNAGSRLLALLTFESDVSAQEAAFRALFFDAERDRLQRARATHATLEPQESESVDCQAAEACVRSALPALRKKRGVGARPTKVVVRGSDFIASSFAASGDAVVESGRVELAAKGAGKARVTLELFSASLPSEEVARALGDTQALAGTCTEELFDDASLPLCAYVFEQNCSPDDCWDPFQKCKENGTFVCHDCKRECTSGCRDCASACAADAACVQRCAASAKACKGGCKDKLVSAQKSCDGTYKSCADKAEAAFRKVCGNTCEVYSDCTHACKADDYEACDEKCRKALSLACAPLCLARFP